MAENPKQGGEAAILGKVYSIIQQTIIVNAVWGFLRRHASPKPLRVIMKSPW